MWLNQLKTAVLLSALSSLFLLIGYFFGGMHGIQIAFVIAVITNVITYYFSEKIVLSMYRAHPLPKEQYDWLYETVHELAHRMNLPMPKLWLINTPMANAFATGRNPSHASIALTSGIIDLLDREELRGVLAHELSHIKNRDILVATIAATLAAAIGYLAYMMRYAAFWGSMNSRDRNRGNPLFLILMALLMPIAAALIQLAISRSREYLADETGAEYGRDPLALASALEKLQLNIRHAHLDKRNTQQAPTAALFIVYPFWGNGWLSLFSTHPPMHLRIARLQQLYKKMF